MKISAILLAAGKGRRLQKSRPKAFVEISGRALFLYSLELFEQYPQISEVVLVVPKSEISAARKLAAKFKKVSRIVGGGKTRMESLAAGLKLAKNEFILSQNAANPFATISEISRLAAAVGKFSAAAVAHRADATVRFSTNSEKEIWKTLPREKIWLMETPQLVSKKILATGLKAARAQKIFATDEIQLAELAGAKIKIIPADSKNRKITRSEDLNKFSMCNVQCAMRIGLGVDSHRFAKTQKALILGGIQIAKNGGLEANSDGDVILHALTNSISSTLGGGSLSIFADGMCRRGIRDSKKYLQVVLKKMRAEHFIIENLAIAVEGSRPKLEKHFPRMKKSLAKLLEIDSKKIGITVTSGEGLTAFGRGEGLQVFTVVLLKSL